MRVANREEGKRVSLKAADEIIADFNRVFIWAGCGKLKESLLNAILLCLSLLEEVDNLCILGFYFECRSASK